jgi:hypothetical protein
MKISLIYIFRLGSLHYVTRLELARAFGITYQTRATPSQTGLFGVPVPVEPGNRLMTPAHHARSVRERTGSGHGTHRAGGLDETKTKVVVPVIWLVPVPVRRANVPR